MKKTISYLMQQTKKVKLAHLLPIALLAVLFIAMPQHSFAVEPLSMPWDNFLERVAKTLTGKTAMTLATIGIAICGIGLFLGNGGDGFRKFLIVILGLCIVLWAGKAVEMMKDSAEQVGSVTVPVTFASYMPSQSVQFEYQG